MKKLTAWDRKQIERMDNLSNMLNQLYEDKTLSDDEILPLVKKVAREPREEVNHYREAFFTTSGYVDKMIAIGSRHEDNVKILGEILNGLAAVAERYDEPSTTAKKSLSQKEVQATYDFIVKHIGRPEKIIRKYLAWSFPVHPLFLQYDKKWEFLLSILELTPKIDFMITFRQFVNLHIESLPNEVIRQYIPILKSHRIEIKKRHTDYNDDDDIDVISELERRVE